MINIYIVGPANGSTAFTLEPLQQVEDDSLFLPSSDLELAPGSTIFKLSRNKRGVRIAIYKQIYESGLQRLGHSFGAVVEIYEVCPAGVAVVETLNQLLKLIGDGCTKDGHFCAIERFRSFLASEIVANLKVIQDQFLKKSGKQLLVKIGPPPGTAMQLFTSTDLNDQAMLSAAVDWFVGNPASVMCEALYLGVSTAGRLGRLLQARPYEDVTLGSLDYLYSKFLAQSDVLDNLSARVKEMAASLEAERTAKLAAESESMSVKEQFSAMAKDVQSLNNRLQGRVERPVQYDPPPQTKGVPTPKGSAPPQKSLTIFSAPSVLVSPTFRPKLGEKVKSPDRVSNPNRATFNEALSKHNSLRQDVLFWWLISAFTVALVATVLFFFFRHGS